MQTLNATQKTKKTAAGRIPVDWEAVNIGEYLKEISVRNFPINTSLPVLSVTNTQGFVTSESYFDRKVYSKDLSNYKIIEKEQFAYNPSRINVGSIAQLKSFDKGCLSPMYVVFEAQEGLMADYLAYWIQSGRFRNLIDASTQGTVRDSVNFSALAGFPFARPPVDEQKKIIIILSCVDDIISKTQAVIDETQRLKKALMQELFTRGLPGRHRTFRPSIFGLVPKEWNIVKIADVATVDYGISESVSANTDPKLGWPILTGANIGLDGELSFHKLVYIAPPTADQFILKKGDILLNWRSGSPAHVGKAAIFDEEGNYTYASFVLRIRAFKASSHYLHALFNFMREHELFFSNVSQQVNFKMNGAVFRELEIPLPTLQEQREIISIFRGLDAKYLVENSILKKAFLLKSALMQILLTGEVRVK